LLIYVKSDILFINVPTRDDLLRQVQKLISIVTDLVKEVSKFIRVDNDLVERYSRSMEELDSIRLSNEELRELIKELVFESGKHADSTNKHLYRVEQYVILKGMMGIGRETLQVESDVAKEHIERALSERLVEQQGLVKQYQKNISIVNERIARYGETVPLLNELEEYQSKLDKALEAMKRIREQLQ